MSLPTFPQMGTSFQQNNITIGNIPIKYRRSRHMILPPYSLLDSNLYMLCLPKLFTRFGDHRKIQLHHIWQRNFSCPMLHRQLHIPVCDVFGCHHAITDPCTLILWQMTTYHCHFAMDPFTCKTYYSKFLNHRVAYRHLTFCACIYLHRSSKVSPACQQEWLQVQ